MPNTARGGGISRKITDGADRRRLKDIVSDLEVPNELTAESDVLLDGGRALGFALIVAPRKAPLGLALTAGVFRSVVHDQLANAGAAAVKTPIRWDEHFPEDVHARVAIEPARGVEIGVAGAWFAMLGTAADRKTFRHGALGSVDAAIARGGLRVWAEAFLGTSPIHLGTALTARGSFAAWRMVAAFAVDTPCVRLPAFEPFLAEIPAKAQDAEN
jgi:hypothetical protein